MKMIFTLLLTLTFKFLYAYDFEFEVLSNEGDVRVMELPDLLVYRQFNIKSNWKDTLGDWGIVECTGTHTLHKGKGTILKNYCKGTNVEDDKFWLIMDRKSDNFDSGIGKIEYLEGTGKFKKYIGTKCVYAVSHLKKGKGSFIKAKCNFSKKDNI
tara:strand:- start:7 stop:471 length:465 start_codon:yes stop_codon:yes gene_type:complete